MAFGYCYLGLIATPQPDALPLVVHFVAMLFSFLGSGLFVRYFNDFCDIDQDRRAGKDNIAEADPPFLRTFKLAGYSAIIPLTLWIAGVPAILFFLMGLQHLLYIIYSLPPIRLKERGWAGVLCDAAYGHAVPAAAGFAFGYTAGAAGSPDHLWAYVAIAGLSQFALGVSNIIYHQLEDHTEDKQAGVQTWVVTTGPDSARAIATNYFIPLSFLALGGYYLLWGVNGLSLLSVLLVVLLLLFAVYTRQLSLSQVQNRKKQALIAANEMTEVWAPVIILIALLLQDQKYFWLFLFHTLGFRKIILPYFLQYIKRLWSGWKWLEGRFVYFYYHKLLIVYARLKKRFLN